MKDRAVTHRKNPKLDTKDMSLQEVLELRKQREWYTQEYRKGAILFTTKYEPRYVCGYCGDHPHPGQRVVGPVLLSPGLVAVDFTWVDDEMICRECFEAYWTNVEMERGEVGRGTCRRSSPRSQREYDGGNFHSGEW